MDNPAYDADNIPDYHFGEDFNYARWTPNTVVTLTNVPWNNDYRDVVRHETRDALNEYIDGIPGNRKITGLSYAKPTQPIDLDIPFNVAQRYNYIRAHNPAQPTDSGDFQRDFYYFVVDVQYRSPRNTRLILQLDVWSTFIHDVQFGRAFVERGHVGIANEADFQNNGRDFLTVPEGLDIGGEYVIAMNRSKSIMSNAYNGSTSDSGGYCVMVVSTVALDRDPGNKDRPQLWTATGSSLQGLPSGASFYVFPTAGNFHAFLRAYSDKPWVTQGILSAQAIPNLWRYFPGMSRNLNSIGAFANVPIDRGQAVYHDMETDWRYSGELMSAIPERYRHLRKFWTYPYMVIELTTNTGNPIILKPESWNVPHATVKEIASMVAPAPRVSFSPMGYNALREPSRQTMDASNTNAEEGWDIAAIIANFPTFAVVNNSSIAYLANNARSIAYSYQSADWSQSKALRGNQVGYDQASAGIAASSQMTDIGIGADQASTARGNQLANDITGFNNMAGIVQGTVMGGIGGLVAGPAGAASGAALGAIVGTADAIKNTMRNDMTIGATNDQLAIRTGAARAASDVSSAQGSYLRDTNKALADFAAKGDYANAIAGINAKVQDAAMLQPSVSGQAGGDTFNLIHGLTGIQAKWKLLDPGALVTIGDYWLRYGYAVQRSTILPPTLAVMTRFTYWKCSEVYIRSSRVTEAHKQMLRGVLEKGTTVWISPSDIGMVDPAANRKLSGIRLDTYELPPIPPITEPPVETVKRKKKKMLVFNTDNPTVKYALAGASPGTPANWIETESAQTAQQWMDATGQSSPVRLSSTDFAARKFDFMAPLQVEAINNGE